MLLIIRFNIIITVTMYVSIWDLDEDDDANDDHHSNIITYYY